MNIAKNMEAIFVAALVIVGATSIATAAVPARHHHNAVVVAQADNAKMPVVTITAKRLSAAEKAAI